MNSSPPKPVSGRLISSYQNYWASLNDSQRTKYARVFGIIVVVVYIVTIKLVTHCLRPDHFFFSMLIFVLFLGDRREFLLHWGPFAFFWVSYDMLRGLPGYLAGRVNVESVYNAEISIIGWLFNGKVPAFLLQEFKIAHSGEWFVNGINFLCGVFYGNHFTTALFFSWLLYWKVRDKTLFRQFVFTFVGTSYAGLFTFLLFPAAPPWWVWKHSPSGGPLSFIQPTLKNWEVSAAGLIDFDKISGLNIFTTMYETFNPNPFAAVPSLHGAYSVCLAIFITRRYGRKGAVMWIWPVGMWFSSLWLNHHYVVDLLLGLIYLLFFYFISLRVFKPKDLSKV